MHNIKDYHIKHRTPLLDKKIIKREAFLMKYLPFGMQLYQWKKNNVNELLNVINDLSNAFNET